MDKQTKLLTITAFIICALTVISLYSFSIYNFITHKKSTYKNVSYVVNHKYIDRNNNYYLCNITKDGITKVDVVDKKTYDKTNINEYKIVYEHIVYDNNNQLGFFCIIFGTLFLILTFMIGVGYKKTKRNE